MAKDMLHSRNISVNVNCNEDIELLNTKFDIVEDIPAELEDFIFLARLGCFEEARELFEEILRPHEGFFPVVAEFADMLLEEGCYDELSQLLTNPSYKTKFSEDECQLLALMRALSEAYIEQRSNKADDVKPKLEVALDLAQNWHDGLRSTTHSFGGDPVEVGRFSTVVITIITSSYAFHVLSTDVARYKFLKSIFQSWFWRT